jgi:hypothetical protein
VLAKTGTGRQADLVRLLATLPGVVLCRDREHGKAEKTTP